MSVKEDGLSADGVVEGANEQFRSELAKLKADRDKPQLIVPKVDTPSPPKSPRESTNAIAKKRSRSTSVSLRDLARFKVLDHTLYVNKPDEAYLDTEEKVVRVYKAKFVGKDHLEFLAAESPDGPLSLSLLYEPVDGDRAHVNCVVVLRTPQNVSTMHVLMEMVSKFCARASPPDVDDILEALRLDKYVGHLQLCKNPSVVNELVKTDERQLNSNFKFGVLHCRNGQNTEEQMFANVGIEGNFLTFLQAVGDCITLKGWTKYRAGLDVKNDITGTESYYLTWHGHEIMYHVANCIPFNPADPQQLERKRQIGNDIVVVVFADDPSAVESVHVFRSHQNHVLFVVHSVGEDYLVRCFMKNDVPPFAPEFPREGLLLRRNSFFRELFVCILVAAERAAYQAPVFASRITRTRTMVMADLVKTYMPNDSKQKK